MPEAQGGDASNDAFVDGLGDDALWGGADNDALSGGTGVDTLSGDGGNDRLSGGTQDDRLSGGDGRDRITGDASNDQLADGPGRDVQNGGAGADDFVFASAAEARGDRVGVFAHFVDDIDLRAFMDDGQFIGRASPTRPATCAKCSPPAGSRAMSTATGWRTGR